MNLHRRNFTITELLTVMAIIAVIAAILLTTLSHIRQKAAYTQWQAWSADQSRDTTVDAFYTFEKDPDEMTTLRNKAMGDPSDSMYYADSRDGDWAANPVGTTPTWFSDTGRHAKKPGLVFDGGDYIPLKHYLIRGVLPNLTVAAWVKSYGTTAKQIIISYDKESAFRLSWIDSNTDMLQFDTTDSASNTVTQGVAAPPDDLKWHHVAGVYDRDKQEKRLYLDGKLIDAQTNVHGGRTLSDGGSGATYGFISSGSKAGAFDGPRNPQDEFHGVIDEIIIFHRALAGSEIEEMYKIGLPAASRR